MISLKPQRMLTFIITVKNYCNFCIVWFFQMPNVGLIFSTSLHLLYFLPSGPCCQLFVGHSPQIAIQSMLRTNSTSTFGFHMFQILLVAIPCQCYGINHLLLLNAYYQTSWMAKFVCAFLQHNDCVMKKSVKASLFFLSSLCISLPSVHILT